MEQDVLEGMPESAALGLLVSGGEALVTFGRVLVYRYDADDIGMRNLAIVALTDAKRPVNEVAAVFGLTATYVSMLRTRARREGSAGLVRRQGRPPKLSDRQVARARELAAQGASQQAIADRFGVARSVISELLSRLGPAAPAQDPMPEPIEEPAADEPGGGVAVRRSSAPSYRHRSGTTEVPGESRTVDPKDVVSLG